VVTTEVLARQRRIGKRPQHPGAPIPVPPGWCPGTAGAVTAANWLRAHHDGAAAPVVLASAHERALPDRPVWRSVDRCAVGGADLVRHQAVMTGGTGRPSQRQACG